MSEARQGSVMRAPPAGYGDESVVVRLLAPRDETEFLEGLRDGSVRRLAYGDALPATPAAVALQIARVPDRLAANEALLLAVAARGEGSGRAGRTPTRSRAGAARVEGAFLGLTMLFGHDPQRHSAELGFWLVSAARRRGVGRRAVAMTLAWGFAGVGLRRIWAVTAADNLAAQRTMQAAGMRVDPTVETPERSTVSEEVDHVGFVALAAEWRHGAGATPGAAEAPPRLPAC